MSLVDKKYITLISSRLDRFKSGGTKFNFRCPYCGDSQKDSKKARGWLLPAKNTDSYYFFCHNCQKSTTFRSFLKNLDYALFKEYQKEHYNPNIETIDDILAKPDKVEVKGQLSSLHTLHSLDDHHHAKRYILDRKVPKKWLSVLRYTDNFKKFTNTLIPNKFSNTFRGDARIVIPFFDSDNKLFGYQGRALYDTNVRYITIILNEDPIKLFNMNNVDFNKTYYVVEGPIDAMFLDNCCAIAGANVSELPNMSNAVIVYDNESRNKDIVELVGRSIKNGYRTCIWPDYVEGKDINDMVLSGYTPSEIQSIIDSNTYKGMVGTLKFNEWKHV